MLACDLRVVMAMRKETPKFTNLQDPMKKKKTLLNHLKKLFPIIVVMTMASAKANQAPNLSIVKSDVDSTNSFRLCLTGSYDDDGLPDASSPEILWEVVVGDEANVVFSQSDQTETAATFSAAGSYVLRMLGSDGELDASVDLFVEVSALGISNVSTVAVSEEAYKDARDQWNLYRNNYLTDGAVKVEYLGFKSSDFKLKKDSEVVITLVQDNSSYRNSLGWYDAGNEQQGETTIWADVATGDGAPLEQGARTSLGLLPKGTDLRFFLIQNGARSGTEKIYQDSNKNTDNRNLVAAKFPIAEGKVLLSFEDSIATNAT